MKIVITGGCGYIGSHIARSLKQQDKENRVYLIDRERHNHTLKGMDGFLHTDYASKQALLWISELEPHVIVHCAGDILVGESVEDPAKYYDNNVAKTIEFLNHVKDLKRIPLILFSSSASVYGSPDYFPVTETESIKPISPYGTSKAIVERLLKDYNQAYKMPSVCFRYFNACGAEPIHHDLGQAPGASHIIARVLEAQINKKPFVLNGHDYNTPDGTCIRDYVHVWDLADAHLRAIDWYKSNPESAAVFNLGTQHGISNQEILDYVLLNYGPVDIHVGPRRPGDPDKLIASANYATEVLGWKPNYSTINQIVDSAYKWYTREL
jgi:UDP-glucose-4-epimerase GalE